ncbi:hypothetical protein SCLCIDRAFT_198530 [Scleroderma citrinum Foug A]|uniref:Uncharacterized protein n=1 Tax=Scleroderma citrinum Foug A TaxID=1036808 RepID=A0A0C2ZWR2_9AGAM|nr:hypothetical protein SCLCIDRAFT_198530 [Scleroderma citrinum Foug A]
MIVSAQVNHPLLAISAIRFGSFLSLKASSKSFVWLWTSNQVKFRNMEIVNDSIDDHLGRGPEQLYADSFCLDEVRGSFCSERSKNERLSIRWSGSNPILRSTIHLSPFGL